MTRIVRSRRWTEAEVEALSRKGAKALVEARNRAPTPAGGGARAKPAKRAKYGNTRTTVRDPRLGEREVHSKLEARLYRRLMVLRETHVVETFVPQFPIPLPGGTRLVVDFLVVPFDRPGIRILDAKGVLTDNTLTKIKAVHALYPWTVECLYGLECDLWHPDWPIRSCLEEGRVGRRRTGEVRTRVRARSADGKTGPWTEGEDC